MPLSQLSIRPIEDGDEEAVTGLWRAAGLTRPWNDAARDIAFCRKGPSSELFVGIAEGNIVAAVMAGHDGHRGVIYYLGVDPQCRHRGLGRRMVRHAENWLDGLGVWKVNLMIRDDNAETRDFYAAIGYETEPRIVMARRLGKDASR